jgi:myo-inositol-1(or 4)-monophosphatase
LTDWLAACRATVEDVRGVLGELPDRAQREPVVGDGVGGDETTAIDEAAERVVVARLEQTGASFTLVSEELGEKEVGGGGPPWVVVDPIDGSLNAKRGLPHFALSIAVADGPTMADVRFGYVYDFGPREEWVARRGEGALLNDVRIDAPPDERRLPDGRLEMLAIESADPRWIAPRIEALSATVYRLRAIGSIAISMCQLAPTRVDGMLTLRRTRAVDVAAAQLIVREAGAVVAFTAFDDPLSAPLDLEPHSPVVAARTPASLARLIAIL